MIVVVVVVIVLLIAYTYAMIFVGVFVTSVEWWQMCALDVVLIAVVIVVAMSCVLYWIVH